MYKVKADRRAIGSRLSLGKVLMHLTTSTPGNKGAVEEHARLLGFLVMQYLLAHPEHSAEVQEGVSVALERLSDKVSDSCLLPLKMAAILD